MADVFDLNQQIIYAEEFGKKITNSLEIMLTLELALG